MDKKIGFIGAGNMGGALIVAACKELGPEAVLITDYSLDKARELAGQMGCAVAESNEALVRSAEHIVLGVKPHVLRGVVQGIAPELAACVRTGKKRVLVSIAQGVPVSAIKACLQAEMPVIRILPNMPALVGQGMIQLTSDAENPGEISEDQFAELQSLLAAAGSFERVDERMMDITSGVSGCTPAFTYMFIEALADGAVQTGVPRAQAMRLAAKAVMGAAAMVLETGTHPGALKDSVCSPGGSTIIGVTTLERYGFRNAVTQAAVRSTEKNCQLGK